MCSWPGHHAFAKIMNAFAEEILLKDHFEIKQTFSMDFLIEDVISKLKSRVESMQCSVADVFRQ